MKIRSLLTFVILLFLAANASARQVHKNNVPFHQPDGTIFLANVRGDGFYRMITTSSGEAITRDPDGWWSYAVYDADGTKSSSKVHVGAKNSETVRALSRDIPYRAIAERADRKRSPSAGGKNFAPITKELLELRKATTKARGDATSYTKHGLVIVCEFKDVTLKSGTTLKNFNDLLNKTGYNVDGAIGCAREYFSHQFGDGWDFVFDVVGPVTLPNSQSYYGGNMKDETTGSEDDKNPDQMIVDALKAADASVDFSKYDDDKDGYIDNVFVFFAGKDESDDPGSNADCIWSHAWYLVSGAGRDRSEVTFDGVIADRYACTSELSRWSNGSYKFAGISTFCHEYSHTLGLVDLYDTDYEMTDGVHQSAGLWVYTALMDGGNINNNGITPPNYNAIDRLIAGIIEPRELSSAYYTLQPIDKGGDCLIYFHPSNENEFFLIECRDAEGWDEYIYGSGLLIYHIDMSGNIAGDGKSAAMLWSLNKVNAYHDHQCADLIEANALDDKWVVVNDKGENVPINITRASLSGLFFPLSSTKCSFSPTTTPAFKFWDGTESQYSINAITRNADGSVSFSVSGSNALPEVLKYEFEAFQNSAIINWKSSTVTDVYPAMARYGRSGSSDVTEVEVKSYDGLTGYALRLDGLAPMTEYTVELFFKDGRREGEVKSFSFTTGKARNDVLPYIIVPSAGRGASGKFTKDARFPLKVYNVLDGAHMEWSYDGAEVEAGPDGYFHPEKSGNLTVHITYKDGSRETITKKINVE